MPTQRTSTALAVSPAPQACIARAEAAEGQGLWAEAREHYHDALAAFRPGDAEAATALVFRRIARCHVQLAEYEAALDCIAVARAAAVAAQDLTAVAHADNLEGIVAQLRGDLLSAERFYREAYNASRSAGDGALTAMVHQNLGTIANIRGEHARARAQYEAALRGFRALGMERPVGPLLNNLGMLYTDLQDWQHAERCFAEAMASCLGCGDVPGHLLAAANCAELYVRRRRFRKARQLCRRILVRARGGCDGQWVAEAHKYLGIIDRELGDLRGAERQLTHALAVAAGREDPLLEAEVLRELASVYHALERYRETLTALNRSHALFATLSARPDVSDIDRRRGRLEEQFLRLVQSWGESIESADHYTQGHCERVADFACQLARDAGLDDDAMLWFRMGALLHDVGKITVPTEVLNKNGHLTDEEFLLIQQHPVAGEALVAGVEFPWDVRPMIRHHHERWDGAGYPDQLAGEEIPLTARILCIADVYDALTSTRPYRAGYSPDRAATIMAWDAGKGLDPVLVELFLTRTLPAMLGRPIAAAEGAPDERSRSSVASPASVQPTVIAA